MRKFELSSDQLEDVVGIDVRVECPGCGGKGLVRGGQVEYGELIDCHVCNGAGTIPASVTLEQLKKLIGIKE